MDIGKDLVAKIRRDEQLDKKMICPPFTRMPKMAENIIVIEEQVIDVQNQCSGNAVVVMQFVGFDIGNQLAERWISALEIMDSVGLYSWARPPRGGAGGQVAPGPQLERGPLKNVI